MCAHLGYTNLTQPLLFPDLVAFRTVLHLSHLLKDGTHGGEGGEHVGLSHREGSCRGIGYLEQGRLGALPVHEAPERGAAGSQSSTPGEVVMVVAVVVTQR
jgi:hypothetical protein